MKVESYSQMRSVHAFSTRFVPGFIVIEQIASNESVQTILISILLGERERERERTMRENNTHFKLTKTSGSPMNILNRTPKMLNKHYMLPASC